MPNNHKHEIEKLNRRDREIELANKVARIENDQRGGVDIVRIAKGSQWTDRTEEIEQFEARWKNVLKSRDDSPPPAH
jgi:Ribonuclease G/E